MSDRSSTKRFALRFIAFLLVMGIGGGAERVSYAAGDEEEVPSRLDRRRGELFLPDEVLDPTWPVLEEQSSEHLLGEGQSDSVMEAPLDPDLPEDAEQQRVIAGEAKDETELRFERDHFDDSLAPFEPDDKAVGTEYDDPVEW